MDTCKYCGVEGRMREDYSDGSVVCTACGVVAEAFLLDDRPMVCPSRDVHYHFEEPGPKDAEMANLEYACFVPRHILVAGEQRCAAIQEDIGIKGINRQALLAACTYACIKESGKGGLLHTMEDMARVTGLPLAKLHEMWKTHLEPTLQPPPASVRTPKSIYNKLTVLLANSRQACAVVRECEALEKHLGQNRAFLNKKPSKMFAAIFWHVCLARGESISEADVLELAGVSSATFKRHLKLIKAIK